MADPDFRHGRAATVAKALSSKTDLTIQDLQAALANIARRVAIMEEDWKATAGTFAAFRDDFERFLQPHSEPHAELPTRQKQPR